MSTCAIPPPLKYIPPSKFLGQWVQILWTQPPSQKHYSPFLLFTLLTYSQCYTSEATMSCNDNKLNSVNVSVYMHVLWLWLLGVRYVYEYQWHGVHVCNVHGKYAVHSHHICYTCIYKDCASQYMCIYYITIHA